MASDHPITTFFAPGGAGHGWWRELHRSTQDREQGASRRGDRAELRRCDDLDAIQMTQSFHRLRLHALKAGHHGDEQLALIAGILAHVEDEPKKELGFGAAMARASKTSQERARVSGLRFRRLIQNESRDELFAPLVRIVRLVGREATVSALATDLYFWGPKSRMRWATDYYDGVMRRGLTED